eukprot:TRINITY_DN1260_c0_g1_i2.p2 TRINITY_DN1260_c0_g1~~TRINITY_DN1260_c0_g1_i2.p2  ORF type:complete len:162 (-),score=15.61 TRINITY_DN1260_c0_g1_i2:412-897(-)
MNAPIQTRSVPAVTAALFVVVGNKMKVCSMPANADPETFRRILAASGVDADRSVLWRDANHQYLASLNGSCVGHAASNFPEAEERARQLGMVVLPNSTLYVTDPPGITQIGLYGRKFFRLRSFKWATIGKFVYKNRAASRRVDMVTNASSGESGGASDMEE